MNKNEKQRRAGVELRALEAVEGGAMRISGKAIAFNSPTVVWRDENGVEYFEQIDPHALDGADMKDTCLRYNHVNAIPILARIRGGSLKLEIREDGVYFEAELFNTTAARDCYELVRQGALQCSFGFTMPPAADAAQCGYIYDRATRMRTITRIERLIDISIVDVPAYKDTFVQPSLRDLFSAEAEAERLESRAQRVRMLSASTF